MMTDLQYKRLCARADVYADEELRRWWGAVVAAEPLDAAVAEQKPTAEQQAAAELDAAVRKVLTEIVASAFRIGYASAMDDAARRVP
jgi:hypothetical protein